MPATLSAAMTAANANTITQPGWLLEIGGTMRVCSRGDLTIMGALWVGADLSIQGLGAGGNLASGGRVTLGDADNAWITLMLSDELADATARVWYIDGDATADEDPDLRFEGVLDAVEADPERAIVTATLALPTSIPWPYYGPALGMNQMIPEGTVMRIGADSYTVERPR